MTRLSTDQRQHSGSLVYLTLIVLVATLGGLLFGYDTAVIAGAIGFLDVHFGLSPATSGWAASSALAGCVLGAALAGTLSDQFGRRNVLLMSAVLFLASALGTALPRDFTVFVIFRILGGIGVGAASMTSPMYIAEISPASIRGRMVSVNQLAIVSGMLIVYFVNYFIAAYGMQQDQLAGIVRETDAWNVVQGWRWMFGSEALPATALLLLLVVVPESPRWLTKRGENDRAHAVLARINGAAHADREMTEIKQALSLESGSVFQLLEPGMRVVLFIGIALAVLQQVTGINVILYYGPKIFEETGVATDVALQWTVLVGAVNLFATLFAIWAVDRLGRKPLMIIGAAGMGLLLLSLGLAFQFGHTGMWTLVLILGYIACFAISVGPVTWVILSEIFPTKIRGRAMAIATICLWAANFVVSQTFPMMADNVWLIDRFHYAFPFYVYAGFCVVLFIVVVIAIPETRKKSLEEIERHWLKG